MLHDLGACGCPACFAAPAATSGVTHATEGGSPFKRSVGAATEGPAEHLARRDADLTATGPVERVSLRHDLGRLENSRSTAVVEIHDEHRLGIRLGIDTDHQTRESAAAHEDGRADGDRNGGGGVEERHLRHDQDTSKTLADGQDLSAPLRERLYRRLLELQARADAARAELMRRNFSEFFRGGWSQLEGGPLLWGRHLDLITSNLQALAEGWLVANG